MPEEQIGTKSSNNQPPCLLYETLSWQLKRTLLNNSRPTSFTEGQNLKGKVGQPHILVAGPWSAGDGNVTPFTSTEPQRWQTAEQKETYFWAWF